jgi:hypothetical protein
MLRVLCILVVLVMVESSCHRHKVASPLPPVPASLTPQLEAHPVPPPAQLEPPPKIPPAPTPAPPQVGTPADLYQVNRPPEPRRSRTAAGNNPAAPTQPAPAPAAPAVTPPRLGDILTLDQQREFNIAIDQSLSRAQASLGSIGSHQLSQEQQSLVEQIRSFMQQAQETRKSDLQGAKRLAERADVLAGDLAASFR